MKVLCNKGDFQTVLVSPKIISSGDKKTNNEWDCKSIIVSGKNKIKILIDSNYFEGILTIPEDDIGGLVIFVHGSGSSGYSSRNEYISEILNKSNISTLLIDLLTIKETEIDNKTKEYRFDIELLTKRLLMITDAISQNESTKLYKLGYFGSSTGAAVAIKAAVQRSDRIITIVSRSGRLDLVDSDYLEKLRASILLLIGSRDQPLIEINNKIIQTLNKDILKKIILISGATHLFAEPGKIEQVARIAAAWFRDNLSVK